MIWLRWLLPIAVGLIIKASTMASSYEPGGSQIAAIGELIGGAAVLAALIAIPTNVIALIIKKRRAKLANTNRP